MRERNKSSRLKIEIKNVEVTTRRNKHQDTCIEDWKQYDIYVIDSLRNAVGCNPPHWKTDLKFPQSTNRSQTKALTDMKFNWDIESFVPPCRVIDRLDNTLTELDLDSNG